MKSLLFLMLFSIANVSYAHSGHGDIIHTHFSSGAMIATAYLVLLSLTAAVTSFIGSPRIKMERN